jgi:hypothetical protein
MKNQIQVVNTDVFAALKSELEVVELEERLEMVSLLAVAATAVQKTSNGCCCCNSA